jgi:hypothetical protein
MEASNTSETSVNFYQTTRRNIPEDNHLRTRRRENLKSRLRYVTSVVDTTLLQISHERKKRLVSLKICCHKIRIDLDKTMFDVVT